MAGKRRLDMWKTGVAALALAAAGPSWMQALAQEAGSAAQATQLETITVEGRGDAAGTGPVDGYVAKRSTAGSKSGADLVAIPQSVSVIARQELEDRGVVTKVDEALRYTAGVTSQPFGTDADTDWFYIRGFDATQTGVFLDGLNLYSYGFGGFQIDAYGLERVDVLKGPASVLYGGANPGGIIDLVRKRPDDTPSREVEIGVNNFGNAFFGFDVNDKATDDGVVTYRVTGKIAGGEQETDYSNDLRGFIMPQITYKPDDATSLTVYAMISGLDQRHTGNGFLPYEGTVTSAPFGRIDRDSFFSEPDLDKGRADQQIVGTEFKHEFDNGWIFSQSLRYAHLDKHEVLFYPYGYVNTTDPSNAGYYQLNRIGFEHDTKVSSFAIDNRLNGTVTTGPLSHELLVGLDYKHYRLDQVQAVPAWPAAATPIDPVDPIYGLPQPDISGTYLDQVLTLRQLGLYAQDQIRFGNGWLVTLNGRHDWVDTESDARIGTSYSANDSASSGRAGLAYEFSNGVTPYVSAATFFNPLIGTAYNGGALKPEEGHQVEAGVKYAPSFMDALLTASVFHIVKQNVALTRPDFLQEQLGEVTSTGVELEGKVNLNRNWRALASYSYTDLEITEDLNPALIGKRPYLIPTHQAAFWLDYLVTDGAADGLSLGAGLRYQGKSYADNLNQFEVPDALLVDAAVRYEKNGWGAALNVANLFDKDYVSGCQGVSTCGYGAGRTITLKLSKKF
ncbi:ferrichrome-iron receptor [Xaviernesmea oryzae]|uniref:Ferrichrome-iron receptor n=2 Tax=Xaviernesmea oryzae TaxID=464029 RepID=A0A1Q9AV01_9HYPH|nr:ferrichrome-iron receptor [Xaviernesmea oryzae]SEK89819.1 iron complex outermembrane recepter protein [Xaviernesmea oryzae]